MWIDSFKGESKGVAGLAVSVFYLHIEMTRPDCFEVCLFIPFGGREVACVCLCVCVYVCICLCACFCVYSVQHMHVQVRASVCISLYISVCLSVSMCQKTTQEAGRQPKRQADKQRENDWRMKTLRTACTISVFVQVPWDAAGSCRCCF